MRFLFALRRPGYARYLHSTLTALSKRGHETVVLVPPAKRKAGRRALLTDELEALGAELEGMTIRQGVEPRGTPRELGASLRMWLTYLRFLEPEFAESPKLRARARSAVPDAVRMLTEAASESPDLRRALAARVRATERSLPVPGPVLDLVAEVRPDAVVACPLIERGAPQTAYLRAARERGVPSAVCVASWDNLTTSSLIFGEPDLVTVWNEAQRVEARELHGIADERVVSTGAPMYDRWFSQRPSTSPKEFAAAVGLPGDRPFVLYVCSSGFIAPDEAAWIRRWLAGVRSSGHPELERLAVLIRPHPQHRLLDGSPAADRLVNMPGVVIHPRDGALPLADATLAEYYDSIYHSAAVVGVNTSAMIETAIVGRGVHVLLAKRYRETQEGLPHFAHLRSAGGGLIAATANPLEHAAGLALTIRGDDRELVSERSRRFLSAFVRPHGLDQPATPLLVAELERLAGDGPVSPSPLRSGDRRPHETLAALERLFG